jgi:hypothetical protein
MVDLTLAWGAKNFRNSEAVRNDRRAALEVSTASCYHQQALSGGAPVKYLSTFVASHDVQMHKTFGTKADGSSQILPYSVRIDRSINTNGKALASVGERLAPVGAVTLFCGWMMCREHAAEGMPWLDIICIRAC